MSFFARACAIAGLVFAQETVFAAPSILVDEVHGQPYRAILQSLWPDHQIDAVTPADFPIETVLATGTAIGDTAITVTVPDGAAVLYGCFTCTPVFEQYPYISVYGPGGGLIARHFRGGFHVENPLPGEYAIQFANWSPEPTPFTIGVGPPFFDATLLASHDILLRVHDNVMMLFTGEIPEYSAQEVATAAAHVENGGGNLLVREPLAEIAMKPIIDLASDRDLTCDVTVALPGFLTYDDPPAETGRVPNGTTASWRDVAVGPDNPTRLCYEAALSPPHHLLEVVSVAGVVRLQNHAAQPLLEVHVARHVRDDRWQLAVADDLGPDVTMTTAAVEFSRAEVAAIMERALADGGRRGGLTAAQVDAFQDRYRWIDRVLDAADGRGCWTAFYRVDQPTCDHLLPLITEPACVSRVRVLWFWVTDIPANLPPATTWPDLPPAPTLAATGSAATSLHLAEYGVIHQRYPARGPDTRDLAWLGWTFHDDAWLLDPTDYEDSPEFPWLHVPGDHPDAEALLTGLPWLGGAYAGGVIAPAGEVVLRGDEDTYTEDGVFPPYSFPPVVVAKDLGLGRAAAVASLGMLDGNWSPNEVFVRRLLAWTADILTPVDDLPPVRIEHLEARPNPFNPNTEIVLALSAATSVRVVIHDAAGHVVRELLNENVAAGEHRLTWDGRDGDGRAVATGVYFARLQAADGVRAIKLTLVR